MKSMAGWMAVGLLVAVSSGAADTAATEAGKTGGLLLPDNLFAQVAAPVAPTTVVAVVEGRELRQSDIDEIVTQALAMNQGRIPPERIDEVRNQISQRAREELIIQMILEHEADARKITVSPEQIDKAKKGIPLPPGQTLEEALAAKKVPMARLDADLMRALKIKALLEQVVPKTEISDAKVKEFYEQNAESFHVPEQVTARHILVQVPAGASEDVKAEKRAKAEGIRKELLAGGDFEALARKHSEDPGSKDNGGVYTFPRGQMVKPFEEAAFTQPINEIGPLVETQFGFHIIQATNRSPARAVDLTEAAPRIRTMLEGRTQNQAVQEYVRGLREKAKVVFPGAGAAN